LSSLGIRASLFQMHSHGADSSAGHGRSHGRDDVSALRAAFAITVSVLLLEAVGGWLTGSVALMADAGHMLTDAGALAIALSAAWMARRPRSAQKSFGYGRAEILGALVNGILLGGVSVGIALEAFERLGNPGSVQAAPMLAIAVVGLAANLLAARLLIGSSRENLNVRAAFLHVLGDALGSVAAIVAGLSLLLFDLRAADAVAALVIAALLVVSAVRLVRESVDVLLEGAPRHLDMDEIRAEVERVPGVISVHDLHIWTVSSGFLAMSAHVDLAPGADPEDTRKGVHRLLHQRYAVEHTTIQTEATAPPELLSIRSAPSEPKY
jgi:cobalt-zinc-cadmium efflux system protein